MLATMSHFLEGYPADMPNGDSSEEEPDIAFQKASINLNGSRARPLEEKVQICAIAHIFGDEMPGFDGTGPRGLGPMTGGARGFCSGYLLGSYPYYAPRPYPYYGYGFPPRYSVPYPGYGYGLPYTAYGGGYGYPYIAYPGYGYGFTYAPYGLGYSYGYPYMRYPWGPYGALGYRHPYTAYPAYPAPYAGYW